MEQPQTSPPLAKPLLSEAAKTGLSVLTVYSAHYATAKLYNGICVPSGFAGYIFGFITTSSPWCRLMLELMKLTENQYSTIVLIAVSRLLIQALGI
jgi:hypothetical protein